MIVIDVIETIIKSAKRYIKFHALGSSDVKEKHEISPFGLDSNPIKGTRGVYVQTATKGQAAVIGYVNTVQKAGSGEIRTYSVDANGSEKTYVWLKADGTIEIGGDSDNMVRYSKLETAFNQLKSDFDNLVNAYNIHVHDVPQAPSGTLPSAPTTSTGQTTTADISPAKIKEIKTI